MALSIFEVVLATGTGVRAPRGFAGLVGLSYVSAGWGACLLPADHLQAVDIAACGASPSNLDNKAFIDAALQSAVGNQYPGIAVPPGVFLTSGGHVPAAGIAVGGAGTLKLTASGNAPIIDTQHAGNKISGLSFDLSASNSASRVAVDIDGGSDGTVVEGVNVNFGRIIAYVTNGGSPPVNIAIRNNVVTSAVVGGTSGGAIEINSSTGHFTVVGNRVNGDWNGHRRGIGSELRPDRG